MTTMKEHNKILKVGSVPAARAAAVNGHISDVKRSAGRVNNIYSHLQIWYSPVAQNSKLETWKKTKSAAKNTPQAEENTEPPTRAKYKCFFELVGRWGGGGSLYRLKDCHSCEVACLI